MLGWLFPRPPVRVYEKAWIEYRFAWLVEQLGADRMLNALVIEPTDEYFPDQYSGEDADAEMMFRRVCGFMQVDPDEIRFEVLPADDLESVGQHYDSSSGAPTLRLADTQIVEPFSLVATLSHEISRHVLISREFSAGKEEDRGRVNDLLACVLGLGIFVANSTVVLSSTTGEWRWWDVQRHLLMPPECVGYSLALFSWLRGERRPRWKRYLQLDARESMEKGLRYLRRTNDCYIHPEDVTSARNPPLAKLATQLASGSPSTRIHAMWDLAKHDGGHSLAAEVNKLLRHRVADVRRVAIETAVSLRLDDEQTIRELLNAIRDHHADVRIAASRALGELHPPDELAVFELGQALLDEVPEVSSAAAKVLQRFGSRAASVEKEILMTLHDALINCDFSMADSLVEALRQAVTDPGQSINDYFHDRDPEFRQMAIDALYSDGDSGIMYDDQC